MKKFLYLVLFSILITGLLPAEGSREVETSLVIEDTTGNTAKLERIPERITFVGKASNMVADALYMFPEASSRIVGVGKTNQRNGEFVKVLDPDYDSKIYLEHTVGPEQIAVTRPDLVIMKNYLKKSLGDPVGQLDIPVLYMNLETPEFYEEDFRMLGEVFGNPERAEELIDYYREARGFVTNRLGSDPERPNVLFLYHTTRDGIAAFNIPPESWIQTRMVEMAGGTPVWTDIHPGGGWSKVNLEQIAAWNPDQIYVVAYKEDINTVIKSMTASTEWQELKAVKNGQLKAFPVDFYSW
ncbi:MAG: ABC transporter substrate-binding protein, partial [Spirochaetales bacterium]|nr:ABC transporter substrate-binding protein [Spirochaetales bacterium]